MESGEQYGRSKIESAWDSFDAMEKLAEGSARDVLERIDRAPGATEEGRRYVMLRVVQRIMASLENSERVAVLRSELLKSAEHHNCSPDPVGFTC